jgi:serpin B
METMTMKRFFISMASVVMVLLLVGCNGAPVTASLLESKKPRVTNPVVSSSDSDALVAGNSSFAFDLYQSLLGSNNGNLFYSPHSISEALAMTYAGARASTETQMAQTLNFTLSQERLHPAFNKLDLELSKRGQGAQGKDDQKGFKLNVVNAIWGQKDYKFLPAFLDTLAQNYGAGLRVLDFIKNPEGSRVTINDWVADQTNDKIKDLIPQGVIDNSTRLVLTNAIYFNAAWKYKFEKSATTDGTFTNLAGTKSTVPMMQLLKSFKYSESGDYQAVELSYDGDEIAMDIIMPKSGTFQDFEKTLTSNQVKAILNGMNSKSVNLTMPRFNVESEFSLKAVLSAMGMTDAFTPDADFSGMNGNQDLLIQDVVHKSFVDVNEEGTEAAAATGVVIGVTSMPISEVDMTIDHPFIFFIRDIPTGEILFIGRVVQIGS